MKSKFYIFISLIFLFACGTDIDKTNRHLSKYGLNLLESKLSQPIKDIINSDTHKLIVYIDGKCSSCLNQLEYWKELSTLNIFQSNIKIVYFINIKSERQLRQWIKVYRIKNYVIDNNRDFLKKNKLLNLPTYYHVFLIDEKNEIKVSGSPIENKKLIEIYEDLILQKI